VGCALLLSEPLFEFMFMLLFEFVFLFPDRPLLPRRPEAGAAGGVGPA
jgi:hypothetical protein